MNPLLEEDYKKWLLNYSLALDEKHGHSWAIEKDETLFVIPVILTIVLYLTLVAIFYVGHLKGKRHTVINSSTLINIKKVAQLKRRQDAIAETIERSKMLEDEAESTGEEKSPSTPTGWSKKETVSTLTESSQKERAVTKEKQPSFEQSTTASPSIGSVPRMEPGHESNESISRSFSSSVPTSSSELELQLPSRTVSHFSSNKSKELSFHPTTKSFIGQVDMETVSKESPSFSQPSSGSFGKEASIPASKPAPQPMTQVPMAASVKEFPTAPQSSGNAVETTKTTAEGGGEQRREYLARANDIWSMLNERRKKEAKEKRSGEQSGSGQSSKEEVVNDLGEEEPEHNE